MTINLKTTLALLGIIALIALGAFLLLNRGNQIVPPAAAPTLAPTPHTLSDAASKAVQDALGWTLGFDPLRGLDDDDKETPPYLAFDLISSGSFITRTLNTSPPVQADILYAYTVSKAGPLVISIVVGADAPDGYWYFDANRFDASLSREAALAEAQAAFPRGRPFTLIYFRYVSLEGIDWAACAAEEQSRPRVTTVCELAREYNQLYPTAEKLFINRLATTNALSDWTTLGWYLLQTYQDDGMPDLFDIPQESVP